MTPISELKATTKICPFSIGIPPSVNGNGDLIDNRSTCVGSACMAWRWQPMQLHEVDPKGICGVSAR